MELDILTAISPIDGRYRSKAGALASYFSEYALIKYRVQVEIEYFIRNFKEIRKQSFLSSLNDNKYYYTPDDYKFFNEKFFKIEKENFFKITNFKEYNGTITLFLDIFSAIYHNEIKSIKTSETLETNKKLILSDDDIHIFLDVISY